MGTVVVDADVLIGFVAPDDARHDSAVARLGPWFGRENTRYVSASGYAEALVRPFRHGRSDEFDAFVDEARVDVVPVDRDVARRAAVLRARHRSLRLPDALTLATALERGAELLTFDERLRRIARSASRLARPSWSAPSNTVSPE